MPSKTINEIVNTVAAVDARITLDIADGYDSGNNHPGCLLAHAELRSGEIETVFLQHVVRSGAPDPVTGIVPVTGKTANILTGAQLTSLRSLLLIVFNQAAVDAGYTL